MALRICVSVLKRRAAALATRGLAAESGEEFHKPDSGKVTHTGQTWEADDFRNVRFLEGRSTKEVNPNWAIKLIDEVPPIKIKGRKIWCDGGHPELGHPKVFINLDKEGPQICGYCGLR